MPSPAAALHAIESRFDRLPRMLQRAASYVSDRPADVAVRSMREVARGAGVAPATMLRLAVALGYPDYRRFRDVFIREVTHESGSYRERAASLQSEALSRPGELGPHVAEAQARAVESVLRLNTPAAMRGAISRITKARRVAFFGLRASHAIAFYFHYIYGFLRENGSLLADAGGTFPDQLENLGPRDCLVAVSVSPYTLAAVQAVEHAAARRVPLVAITDRRLSPIARPARHVLVCATEAPSFFSSMAGPVALVEQLCAHIAATGGKAVLERLRATDLRLRSIHAYWDRQRERGAMNPKPARGR